MASELAMLSDELVDKIAAFDLTKNMDLHDPRFGNAGNIELLCPTCNMRNDMCVGHHASLSLGVHMFHPLMYKESQKIINNKCLNCNNMLYKVSNSRAKRCTKCETVNHGDYVIFANNLTRVFRQNNHEHNILPCELPEKFLPDGYIISKVLVPPIHLRTLEDMEWPTDLQKLYVQLVLAVRTGKDVCKAYSRVIGAYKKEGVTGLMSGKNGIFRLLMMGKRVERSARAVIVGDPYLELDQVGVPKKVASSVKIRVSCTKHNKMFLKDLASSSMLWWPETDDIVDHANVLEGLTFDRALKDGDVTMFNRQPSLSRVSLMCFRVVIRKDDHSVFSMNPQTTPPFNADFDGDEMNMFFMSSKAEMVVLCNISECRDWLIPVQDVVTGCYIMSTNDAPVSREVWDDCAMYCKNAHTYNQQRTTFGLLSMCIPGYNGGKIHKHNFKSIRGIDVYALQLVVERWLSVHGLTVSLKSITTTPVAITDRDTIESFNEKCINTVRTELRGTGLMNIIESGAKGSLVHATHMAIALGQQYIGGKKEAFCDRSYLQGLTSSEFFSHQMAAREGVVSTGVATAFTGYLNRRACKIIADLKVQYNGTVADNNMVSSFKL